MITTLAVSGYRSLRDVVVPLHGLDVVTGANGSGKSSLYRALRLLAGCATGSLAPSLALEGGLPSALWAGPQTLAGARRRGMPVQGTTRSGPISLRLGYATDDGFSYLVDLGLPRPDGGPTAFSLDPEIKREWVWSGPVARPGALLVQRRGPLVRARVTSGASGDHSQDGGWAVLADRLPPHLSMLTELADPRNAAELYAVREDIRAWRFYDGFRVDADAPARRTQIGTRTPVLNDDGSALAAALQTIREIGDAAALDAAVADAFDGATVQIETDRARFDLALRQPGMLRPLSAAELSDGTLRYLLLVAALLTPRPPRLMVLNEPETSLHPDLLGPLSRLIRRTSERTQILVVSHADALIDASGGAGGQPHDDEVGHIRLAKDLGETMIAGQGLLTMPAWHWGKR